MAATMLDQIVLSAWRGEHGVCVHQQILPQRQNGGRR